LPHSSLFFLSPTPPLCCPPRCYQFPSKTFWGTRALFCRPLCLGLLCMLLCTIFFPGCFCLSFTREVVCRIPFFLPCLFVILTCSLCSPSDGCFSFWESPVVSRGKPSTFKFTYSFTIPFQRATPSPSFAPTLCQFFFGLWV